MGKRLSSSPLMLAAHGGLVPLRVPSLSPAGGAHRAVSAAVRKPQSIGGRSSGFGGGVGGGFGSAPRFESSAVDVILARMHDALARIAAPTVLSVQAPTAVDRVAAVPAAATDRDEESCPTPAAHARLDRRRDS